MRDKVEGLIAAAMTGPSCFLFCFVLAFFFLTVLRAFFLNLLSKMSSAERCIYP